MKFNLKEYKLSEVSVLITDGTHSTHKRVDNGFLLATIKDMSNDSIDFEECRKISFKDYEILKKNNCVPKIDDVLFAKDGSILKEVFVNKQSDFAITSHIALVRVNEEFLIPEYLKYYLSDKNIKKDIVANYSSGSVIPSIILKDLNKLIVKIPNINIQKSIVKILESIDIKIKVNSKINKNLGELAEILYKRWFVDFEFPNEEGKPYKSSGGEMIDSELGSIPKGWEIVVLGEILKENIRGISPIYTKDTVSGVPVINQRCLRNHTIIDEAVQYHDNKIKNAKLNYYHNEWDVLVNSMGVGTLGRVSVSGLTTNNLVHSCISILRHNHKVKNGFFSLLMLSLENRFKEMGEGTTGQTSLSNKEIGKIKVIIPSILIQDKINKSYVDIILKIDINNLENKKLSKLRDLLLPKLMSGEIEVPDME
jgi:type I restriction enzyme S subunit